MILNRWKRFFTTSNCFSKNGSKGNRISWVEAPQGSYPALGHAVGEASRRLIDLDKFLGVHRIVIGVAPTGSYHDECPPRPHRRYDAPLTFWRDRAAQGSQGTERARPIMTTLSPPP
jgi:hypothetical protein